jgi:hypothetical protein
MLFGHFSERADLQDVSMDGSVIRANACAAGAANSTAGDEALGRSKGGFGSKIHALCDALGMPIKYLLTGGQEADCKQAIPLAGKRQCLSRFGGQGLRHERAAGVVGRTGNQSRHSTQIQPKRGDCVRLLAL